MAGNPRVYFYEYGPASIYTEENKPIFETPANHENDR